MFPARVHDPNAHCAPSRTRAVISLAVISLGQTACSIYDAHTSPVAAPSASRPATSTAPTHPTSAPSASSSGSPTFSSSTPRATFDLGYEPLFPFRTLSEAQSWQEAHRSGGHQAWHLDAGQTALSFTSGWLGFQELDTVTSTVYDRAGAHIGVGYKPPMNGHLSTAAVLHLVRFGTDQDSPWEVVGSDDDTKSFSLEQPTYGSTISSPMTVGGHITGVDENIKITVRQLSSEAGVGQKCCLPAGPVNPPDPWSTSVTFTGSGVFTIVASTGGHLYQVERFAIQGVHT
jgi:hypothetical protein